MTPFAESIFVRWRELFLEFARCRGKNNRATTTINFSRQTKKNVFFTIVETEFGRYPEHLLATDKSQTRKLKTENQVSDTHLTILNDFFGR